MDVKPAMVEELVAAFDEGRDAAGLRVGRRRQWSKAWMVEGKKSWRKRGWPIFDGEGGCSFLGPLSMVKEVLFIGVDEVARGLESLR